MTFSLGKKIWLTRKNLNLSQKTLFIIFSELKNKERSREIKQKRDSKLSDIFQHSETNRVSKNQLHEAFYICFLNLLLPTCDK